MLCLSDGTDAAEAEPVLNDPRPVECHGLPKDHPPKLFQADSADNKGERNQRGQRPNALN